MNRDWLTVTRDSQTRWFIALGALLALGVAAWFGLRAPVAPAVTFVSLKGEKIATADLRGKVTLVNFWATDCAVCRKDMPELVRTYEMYRGRGVEVVAVAMRYDPPNYVLRYVAQERVPFTVALDPLGELARAFGDVRATPTLVVIDKAGRIRWRVVGEPDFPALHRLIDAALAA